MIEGEGTEVPEASAPTQVEIPFILQMSLFIPVFAVMVFIFQRLFGGRAASSAP